MPDVVMPCSVIKNNVIPFERGKLPGNQERQKMALGDNP
jgi:hypothetical protein